MRLGVFFCSQNLRKKDFFNDFNFAGAAHEFLAPAKINQKIRLDKSIRASTGALRKIRASLRHNPKNLILFPQSRRAARISRGGSWISWEVWCKGWRRFPRADTRRIKWYKKASAKNLCALARALREVQTQFLSAKK